MKISGTHLSGKFFPYFLMSICLIRPYSAFAQEAEPSDKSFPKKSTIALKSVEVEILKPNSALSKEILFEELENALVATRKFEVLTRNTSKLAVVRDEQEFSKSDLSSGNSAETGKLETADFIVVPVITAFSFGRSANPIPNIDSKYYISDSGNLSTRFQILDSTTGAIKNAIPTDVKFSTGQSIANSSKGSPSSASFRSMCKDTAKQFVTGLINTIYPTKIIKITEQGEIWLNRGKESGIAIGDVFKVYAPGEELRDPDTGESLGSAEVFKGEVKIIRTNPKASVAKAHSTKIPKPFSQGDIIRGN